MNKETTLSTIFSEKTVPIKIILVQSYSVKQIVISLFTIVKVFFIVLPPGDDCSAESFWELETQNESSFRLKVGENK